MNVKIIGKEITTTEAIKEYVEKKLDRIEKYFEDTDVNVFVTIKTVKTEQIAEINVNAKNNSYRAEVSSRDLYASIDKGVDILEGQIRKIKTKKERLNKDESIRMKENNYDMGNQTVEQEVIKTIYYEIKPITVEDAKLKLQEKPLNQFITFLNLETNKVNVLYRLKDSKNFGLIEPEV